MQDHLHESSLSETQREKRGVLSSLGEIIRSLFFIAIIVVPIRLFVAQPFIVNGSSMDPTFTHGDYLIIDEISYRLREPERGDVVVLRSPVEKKYLIKRIMGLPGETVTLSEEHFSVTEAGSDGKTFEVPQPFVRYATEEPRRTISLGENEYLVLGDNRAASFDSRFFGPIPRDRIIGYALFRLFPFSNISVFPGSISLPTP